MNIQQWEKTRAKGQQRFIWVNGFLKWGVSTAILWSIIMELIQPSSHIMVRPTIAITLFPLGGLVWGFFVWSATEKKYKAYKEEHKDES